MKASIDETGKLTVAAETPLESYALKNWFQRYALESDLSAKLHIEYSLRANDHEPTT